MTQRNSLARIAGRERRFNAATAKIMFAPIQHIPMVVTTDIWTTSGINA
jgi:hypothetical protein